MEEREPCPRGRWIKISLREIEMVRSFGTYSTVAKVGVVSGFAYVKH